MVWEWNLMIQAAVWTICEGEDLQRGWRPSAAAPFVGVSFEVLRTSA